MCYITTRSYCQCLQLFSLQFYENQYSVLRNIVDNYKKIPFLKFWINQKIKKGLKFIKLLKIIIICKNVPNQPNNEAKIN